jgi:hypothetical protein
LPQLMIDACISQVTVYQASNNISGHQVSNTSAIPLSPQVKASKCSKQQLTV